MKLRVCGVAIDMSSPIRLVIVTEGKNIMVPDRKYIALAAAAFWTAWATVGSAEMD